MKYIHVIAIGVLSIVFTSCANDVRELTTLQENTTTEVATASPHINEVISAPPTPELRAEKTKAAVTLNKYDSLSEFKGAFFTVLFPSDFTAEGRDFYEGSQELFDGAAFTSPDKRVSFYVFSPQWSGIPSYADPQQNETLVSTKTDVVSDKTNNTEGTETTYKTIRANDNSYTRSLVIERKGALGMFERESKTFEIKYTKQEDYDTYRDAYLKFKRSLVQYSD